ncbi:MAG: tetratricopeptide repeat protein [Steroidobacteraceae bacterium]
MCQRPYRYVLLLTMSLLTASPSLVTAASKQKAVPTLKDLAGKRIEVQPNAATTATQEQAATAYREFLELQNADSKLRVEAMRRLGDLNVEVTEGVLAESADVTVNQGLQESITLYENLLNAYPDYASADAVLYQLSRAYEAASQPAKALASLNKLVAQHPNSTWYGEAQFRRGELLFSGQRYAEAATAYAAVVKLAEATAFYDQGLYKQGWALFKQGRVDDSAASFLTELDRLLIKQNQLRDLASLSRAERELNGDILHILAIMASDENGPESISSMLNQHADPAYGYLLFNGLGDLYIEKERYQDAAQAFSAFAKRKPDARQSPTLQARAIEAYEKGGFAAKVLEAKQAFVESYAFDAPFWKSRKPADAPEVAAQLKSNLQDLAQYYHAQASKTKQDADYMAATRWYGSLLSAFPDDPQASANRYLLAELLFDAGRFADATQEYERTAYDYPVHAKSAAAGYAALVAYQKHEPTLTGAERDTWHRKFIDSAVMFATSFPTDVQAAPVLTKAAEDLFALNEFDRTIAVAQQLLARQPPADLKQRRTATTLLAHSLFDRARYPEAEAAYLQVRNLLASNDADLPAINDRIAATIYKQAEASQAAGDAAMAVDTYLRVAALAPTSAISATAEFDAAAVLITQNNWPRAITVLEQFRRVHPGHELTAEVGKKLALGYQQSGRGLEAAIEYERIAERKEESTDVRRAALAQAAELYLQAANKGDASAAVRATTVYARYVAQYPQPFDEAIEARQHLAELAATSHDSVAQSRWLRELVDADKQAGAARTDRSKYLAARASLMLLQPQVDKFNAIKLSSPLAKFLKLKRTAMEEVLNAYGQALDYQVAEVTTEASYGMAEMYRQMGADVMASERPKNLDADALEQYEVLLEEQAFPFEEKAIELHESNLQHDSFYDTWMQKSYAALVKLVPGRYARNEVSGEYVNSLQ